MEEKIKKEFIKFIGRVEDANKIWTYLSNSILAGGFITDVYIGNINHNDIDFFFRDKWYFNRTVEFLSKVRFIEKKFETNNVTTFLYKKRYGGVPIQLITTTTGTPQEIINSFDLSTSKAALDLRDNKLYFGENFIDHISNKEMIIENFKGNPVKLFLRAEKYVREKGFKLDEMDKIKLTILLQAVANKPEEYKVENPTIGYGSNGLLTPIEALRRLRQLSPDDL